jgi:hypothetical protein
MLDSVPIPPGGEIRPSLSQLAKKWLSNPATPLALAVLFLGLDIFTGPYVQFPVTFVIPVALSAWYGKFSHALFLALAQPIANLVIVVVMKSGIPGMPIFWIMVNSCIRASVLVLIACLIHRMASQHRELARRIGLLRSEIPVCFECGKVRDELGNWTSMRTYVSRHTDVNFTNCLCGQCKTKILETPPVGGF